MKKIEKNRAILYLSLFILLALGCKKTENLEDQVNKMDFSGDYRPPTAIDQWLLENITNPYNIKIKYYWDRSELSLTKSITPIDENKVIPVAQTLLKYFLQPYRSETTDYFIKTYPPKQYIFVGSAEYNSNGSVTVGSADAGKKITLFRLNSFNPDNRDSLLRVLKTIHHEFGHILHQNAIYSPDYKSISAPADYLGDEWVDHTDAEAYQLGFVSAYARNQPNEDFAEMIAILLVYGQRYFDNIVEMAGVAGAAKLRAKETMIVEYYRQLWNIDFRALQSRIQSALPPEPTLASILGYHKKFVEFKFVESDASIKKSTVFAGLLPAIKSELLGYGSRALDYILFNFDEIQGELRVRMYATYPSGSTNNSLRFKIIPVTDKTFKLQLYDPASGSFFNATPTLRNYLSSNTFKIEYQGASTLIGGFYVVGQEQTNFVTGILQ